MEQNTDLYGLLRRSALREPDKTALIYQGARISYAQFLARIDALASGLWARGVGPGCRVGLFLPNCPQFLTMMYACHKLGAVLIPFNIRNHIQELHAQLVLSECEWMFYDAEKRDLLLSAAEGADRLKQTVSVDPDCSGNDEYSAIPAGEGETAAIPAVTGDMPLLCLFTGGTTGNSKLAVHSAEALSHWVTMKRGMPRCFTEDDVFLQSIPLFHSAGIGIAHDLFTYGATMVLMKYFRADDYLHLIDRYGVTQLFLIPPTLISVVAKNPRAEGLRLDSVRMISLSGGSSSRQNIRQAFDLFPNTRVCLVYASSERWAFLLQVLTREQCMQEPERMDAVGRPYLGTQLRLVDENGKEVPPGEPGLALVRSSVQMSGYYGRAPLEKDAWSNTGDIMCMDPWGDYCFLSRQKDCIKTGGENVFAVEVERVIGNFPGVADCAVVGVADETYCEIVAAAVVTDRPVSGEELVNWCRSHMAGYKKPRAIWFLPELPKTKIGKTDKQALKALLNREPDYRLPKKSEQRSNIG